MKAKTLLTVAEVAERLGLHRNTIYSMVQRSEIPAVPIGRGRNFRIPLKWVEQQESGASS